MHGRFVGERKTVEPFTYGLVGTSAGAAINRSVSEQVYGGVINATLPILFSDTLGKCCTLRCSIFVRGTNC